MTVPDSLHNRPRPAPPISRGHQPAIAAVVVAALVAVAAWFVGAGGLAGRLVPYRDDRSGTTGFRIDINTASRPELLQLPGVGPATADRILRWRAVHGRIRSSEEILGVPGIGPATLDRLRPYLLLPEDP
jgi:competence protein ComEA